jgi:SAM-dependent methyltransferase
MLLMFGMASGSQAQPEREPDVVYIPTPNDVVEMMLHMARVTEDDVLYDLGCGDGRILVAAADKYGCKAVGYDIDPQRVQESLENVRRNGLDGLVRVEEADIFTLDLRPASVIALYLLPSLNVKLIPQLEKLAPGCRIVSHDFDMSGVRPDAVLTMESEEDSNEHTVYLWTTPLKKEDGASLAAVMIQEFIDMNFVHVLCFLILVGRLGDIVSTRMLTPTLKLEGNLLVRRLGWRFALGSLLLCLVPYFTIEFGIVVLVPSLLVSASNIGKIWLIRGIGEDEFADLVLKLARRGKLSHALGAVLSAALFVILAGLVLWYLYPGTRDGWGFWFGMGIMFYGAIILLHGSLYYRRLFKTAKAI